MSAKYRSLSLSQSLAYTCTGTHTHTLSLTHTRTLIHTRMHVQVLTYVLAHTRTNTHTNIHTHYNLFFSLYSLPLAQTQTRLGCKKERHWERYEAQGQKCLCKFFLLLDLIILTNSKWLELSRTNNNFERCKQTLSQLQTTK